MADDEPHVLLRQSPRALDNELRFASRPCVGGREFMGAWRDQHNKKLTAAQVKKEGKVASVPLSEGMLEEYTAFRSKFAGSWSPLPPPGGLRELMLVPQDETTTALETTADKIAPSSSSTGMAPLPRTAPGGYARMPALHCRRLVFVSEGDLWLAELPADMPSTLLAAAAARIADEATMVESATRDFSRTGEATQYLEGASDDDDDDDDLPLLDVTDETDVPPVSCCRLTTGGGCSHPHFSPDGNSIAYSSTPHGTAAAEVFVARTSSGGGGARQLTRLGDSCHVAGWTPDGMHPLLTIPW